MKMLQGAIAGNLSHMGTVKIQWANEWKEPSTITGRSQYPTIVIIWLVMAILYVTDESLQIISFLGPNPGFHFTQECESPKDRKQYDIYHVPDVSETGRVWGESRRNKW